MTTTLQHPPVVTRDALTWHRPLLVLACGMLALVLVSLIGLMVDQRVLLGAPIWAKPFKFAVSILVYAITLSWLTASIPKHRRLAWWAGTIAAIALLIEMVIITGAVIAGTTSHFNVSTPLHAALWATMAISIVVVWLITLFIGVLLAFARLGDSARAWAIRGAVVLGLAGMALAFLMTSPTSAQLGNFQGIAGAHAVGVADGGPGLPILGWSTVAGDLRVPHFVGMHALQVLPLAIVLLELGARRVPALNRVQTRRNLMIVLSALYAAVIAILTVQALTGQSVVRPDAAVSAITLAVFGAAAVASALIVSHGGRIVRALAEDDMAEPARSF
ncbi:MAG: hypothetical protein JWM23_251 [Microbacteriaceae bacterium]|jgi:hypothetical protein|nr:hypothetical protein [Microbacteriaceae bacterium]